VGDAGFAVATGSAGQPSRSCLCRQRFWRMERRNASRDMTFIRWRDSVRAAAGAALRPADGHCRSSGPAEADPGRAANGGASLNPRVSRDLAAVCRRRWPMRAQTVTRYGGTGG